MPEITTGRAPKKAGVTKDQCKDAGLALILIGLLVHHFAQVPYVFVGTIVVLLVVMTKPVLVKPFAVFWFGLSEFMGTIMSKIFLSLMFFFIVTPIGLLRRMLGKDSLKLRTFKKDAGTAYRVCDKLVTAGDLEHPY